ncbi:MAG: hypothetical protein NC218_01850 [Acetobacter sp.]|nr:hypothetical protein [Acetobacter sp.]
MKIGKEIKDNLLQKIINEGALPPDVRQYAEDAFYYIQELEKQNDELLQQSLTLLEAKNISQDPALDKDRVAWLTGMIKKSLQTPKTAQEIIDNELMHKVGVMDYGIDLRDYVIAADFDQMHDNNGMPMKDFGILTQLDLTQEWHSAGSGGPDVIRLDTTAARYTVSIHQTGELHYFAPAGTVDITKVIGKRIVDIIVTDQRNRRCSISDVRSIPINHASIIAVSFKFDDATELTFVLVSNMTGKHTTGRPIDIETDKHEVLF